MERCKRFIKMLELTNGKYKSINIFTDLIQMTAIAIKNYVFYEQEDEDIYIKVTSKYNKDEKMFFAKLLSELILTFEEEKEFKDILGNIYSQLGGTNQKLGQIFTPQHIAEFMSNVLLDKVVIKNEEITTFQDPACGSGVMLLAAANTIKDEVKNYKEKVLFIAQDIDFNCFCMAYVQMSLYKLPGIVILGDTLKFEKDKIFYTPEFFSRNWHKKIEKNLK